ncbi:WbqC family protein [Fulvivirga lutimaris]|uniref:WbqC family protein n=1 Tax=Fulvivirga lutimaris TaxID=1819566 RepID=UPI0012BD1B81|nr:WbqC family protein [Fulvivirga lutimaris]MTI38304.1 hypothetical protein [Fulvivirga lutimaris]
MKVAIMQPYIFPYVGYFQLIKAVDVFVFYDDVNFIKKGYINKNTILLEGKAHDFTLPCHKISQNKLINETYVAYDNPAFDKLIKTFDVAYKSAPNYEFVKPLFYRALNGKPLSIAELAEHSVIEVCKYLGLKTQFLTASKLNLDNRHLNRADRLIDTTTQLDSNYYINAIGGQKLYSKDYFEERNVKLDFLQPNLKKYDQGMEQFIPGLSIIDALMWCSIEEVIGLLEDYQLV